MNRLGSHILISAVGLAMAACGSTPVLAPVAQAPASDRPAAVAPAPAQRSLTAAPLTTTQAPAPASVPVAAATVATVALPPHLDPANPIASERSVYFDFDEYVLKRDFSGLLERHGRYLASRPSLAIKIEGNSDERGSAEYNLALGQKRAEAVLRALKIYGVRDTQVEPISWGEERPQATGHHEAAWSLNRRADLMYPRQ